MVKMNVQIEEIGTPSKRAFLDTACDYMRNGEVRRAKEMLFKTLMRVKRHLDSREWELYLSRVCLCHPVHTLIHDNRYAMKALVHPQAEERYSERSDCPCSQRAETLLHAQSAFNSCILCQISACVR